MSPPKSLHWSLWIIGALSLIILFQYHIYLSRQSTLKAPVSSSLPDRFQIKPIKPCRDSDVEAQDDMPSLFYLMPHLNNNRTVLQPHRSTGQLKHNVEMVLAVPHVHRLKGDYLLDTITSLFTSMTATQRSSTVLVIMVAEPWNETIFDVVVKKLKPRFGSEIAEGSMQVISPSARWYPDLKHLPSKWGDKPEHVWWRTKQNLDYAFMMLHCSRIGKFYVQLEDDVTAKDNYITKMKNFAATNNGWELLEFSKQGFIGKMFRSEILPRFASFILIFYKHKPVDWLLDNYFGVQECWGKSCSDLSKIRKLYTPPLFQHEGYHSSRVGKTHHKVKIGDQYRKGVFSHDNPPANLSTNFKHYKNYSLEDCYTGKDVFWVLNPHRSDYMSFKFLHPIELRRYKIVTGDAQHRDDRLQNATLEVQSAKAVLNLPVNTFRTDDASDFIALQYFNTSGRRSAEDTTLYTIAEGAVPVELNPITELRVVSHSESQNWVVFSEIWLVT